MKSADRDLLRSAIRSDGLRAIREFLSALPALQRALGSVFQVRLVIDTNIVLGDLIFLAKSRRNTSARTALQELVDSGTVQAFAPDTLAAEVDQHLATIATDKGVAIETLRVHWTAYRPRITLVPSSALPTTRTRQEVELARRDPADLPFLLVQRAVGAAGVVTNDRHLSGTGALVEREILIDLRAYARSASIVLHLSLGGVLVTLPVVGGLVALGRLIARMPNWLKVSLVVGGIVYLSDRDRRHALVGGLRKAGAALQPAATATIDFVSVAGSVLHEAKLESAIALDRAQRRLPKPTATSSAAPNPLARSQAAAPLSQAATGKRVKNGSVRKRQSVAGRSPTTRTGVRVRPARAN